MARTINAIVAELDAAQQKYPVLAALNSPSATAIYRLWKFVVAYAIFTLETLMDRFRADVDAIVARAPVGTPAWYADRALEFQLGDTLMVRPDGAIGYAPDASGAKIVTRATAKENAQTGKLFIKVAKNGPTPGTLAPLDDATELVQVRGYFDRLRFAGTRLEVVTSEADRLRLYGQVYYDPLLDVASVKAAVAQAIRDYLQRLEFDGQLYLSRLVDAIQAVNGVRDVLLTEAKARLGSAPLITINRVYETAAGYIVEDAAPLGFANTLEFLPDGL
jgi:hypothetical protein